jgi:hypothetical protein
VRPGLPRSGRTKMELEMRIYFEMRIYLSLMKTQLVTKKTVIFPF